MYFEMFTQMRKTLAQLDTWLEKATASAKARSFDPDLLVTARLAPDQFGLARQVQSACDTLKIGAFRLTGKAAPAHDDTEKTIEELRARVRSTLAYLDTLGAKDFEAAATREITQPRWEGRTMTGADYFREHVVPNFHFHAAHTYALLRHNGIPLGKRDYLGALTQKAAPIAP